MAWKPKKFQKGRMITSIPDFLRARNHSDWFFLRDDPKHQTILFNMSLSTIQGIIGFSLIHVAVVTKEYKKWNAGADKRKAAGMIAF